MQVSTYHFDNNWILCYIVKREFGKYSEFLVRYTITSIYRSYSEK